MLIGSKVYANVFGYQGSYVVTNQIGNKYLLAKVGMPKLTLLVGLEKIIKIDDSDSSHPDDDYLSQSFYEEISEKF